MKKLRKKNRRSIITILLKRIFITIILFNIIQAGFMIYDAVNSRKQKLEKEKQLIEDEIKSSSFFLYRYLESLSSTLTFQQQQIIQDILQSYQYYDLQAAKLKPFVDKLLLPDSIHDIYIIKDNIVVNTTYRKDFGMNFSDFGDSHVQFLHEIKETGQFKPGVFVFESSTGKLRSYAYQATPDKKYIIEVGSYSDAANDILDKFRQRLHKIMDEFDNVHAINLWIGFEDPINFLHPKEENIYIDTLIDRAFLEKKSISTSFKTGEKSFAVECLYFQLDNVNYFYSNLAASIVFDETDKNKPIVAVIRKQAVATSIYLTLLLTLLFIETRSFKTVMKDLIFKTTSISQGNLHERVSVKGDYELTTLAEQFNMMLDKLSESYNELKNRKLKIKKQHDILVHQKSELDESLQYAKSIQNAVLPPDEYFDDILPEHFIFFKPRDLVSGDFYWIRQIKNIIIVIAADCTGHGVPGAFMSMLGVAFLNEIIISPRLDNAGELLNRLRKKVKISLRQTGELFEHKDGMDIALCAIDTENRRMQFAGAFNPLYFIRNGEINIIHSDRQPIAIFPKEKEFTTHFIDYKEGDIFYIFSDGYFDQLGGEHNKKFLPKRFKQLLLDNHKKTMHEQKEILDKTITEWTKGTIQVDDILVIGFKL